MKSGISYLIPVFLLGTMLCGLEIPLPEGWSPGALEPTPGTGGCTSCGIKAGKGETESPFINETGRGQLNIDLSTNLIPDVLFLKMQLGTQTPFAPSTTYGIMQRNRDGKRVVSAKFGGAQILFPVAPEELGEEEVFSDVHPEYSIRKVSGQMILANKKQEYLFEAKGNMWRLTEIRKRGCSLRNVRCEYNDDGLMTGMVLPDGHKFELQYRDKLITFLTDPAGAMTEITWEEGRIIEVKTTLLPRHPFFTKEDASLNVVRSVRVKFDDTGRLSSVITTNGDQFSLEYGEKSDKGYFTRLYHPDGSVKFSRQTTNDSGDTRTTESGYIIKSPQDGTEMFRFENQFVAKKIGLRFQKVSEIENGRKMTFDYAEGSRKKNAQTDALGRTTRYQYDRFGNITTETYPDGGVNSYRYDDRGRLIESNREGRVNRYVYQGDWVVSFIVGELETKYRYDDFGHPVETILPDGTVYRFEWDELNRLTAYLPPSGVRREFRYADALENVTEIVTVATDGSERYSRKFQYESKGRLAGIIYPDGTRESFVYNCCNMVKQIDRAGAVTQYAYDAGQRKTLEISPNNEKTSYAYDDRGNLTKITYPNGTVRSYEYDAYGKVVREVDPRGFWKKYSYDDAGNRLSLEAPEGARSQYTYDSRDRLIAITGDAEPNIRYTYDKAGDMIERLDFGLPAAETGRKQSYEYDKQGRVIKITHTDGSSEIWHYASNGRLEYKMGHGMVNHYAYDAAGRITSTARIPKGKFTEPFSFENYLLARRIFDKFGNISELRGVKNRLLARYNYTPDGELCSILRPTSEILATLESYVYSYKSDGIREVTIYSKAIALK